jgi:hypothetical protein
MSSADLDPQASAASVHRPFSGPSRWVAAVLVTTGALLQVVEFLLESPLDDNTARVAYWAEHASRIAASQAAGLLAIPFLIGGFGVMVALSRERSPRLAWTAAAFLTCAMVGLAAIHGLEMAAAGLVRGGNPAAAVSVLNGDTIGAPGIVLFILFLGGAALGTLTIAAALWRSPLVPRAVPVLILLFAVLDFAVGLPVESHLVALVNGFILAWAVVTGYSRQPRAAKS